MLSTHLTYLLTLPTHAHRTAAPGDVYALQHSLALVVSHPQHAAALCMLARILHNILANPFESKYRQVKLSNPKARLWQENGRRRWHARS